MVPIRDTPIIPPTGPDGVEVTWEAQGLSRREREERDSSLWVIWALVYFILGVSNLSMCTSQGNAEGEEAGRRMDGQKNDPGILEG
jgi:hypothetical protein